MCEGETYNNDNERDAAVRINAPSAKRRIDMQHKKKKWEYRLSVALY